MVRLDAWFLEKKSQNNEKIKSNVYLYMRDILNGIGLQFSGKLSMERW